MKAHIVNNEFYINKRNRSLHIRPFDVIHGSIKATGFVFEKIVKMAVLDERLYILGGHDADANPVDSVYCLSRDSDGTFEWRTVAAMNVPRSRKTVLRRRLCY